MRLYHRPRVRIKAAWSEFGGHRRNKRFLMGARGSIAGAARFTSLRERERPPLSKISRAVGRVYEYWHVGERVFRSGAHKGELRHKLSMFSYLYVPISTSLSAPLKLLAVYSVKITSCRALKYIAFRLNCLEILISRNMRKWIEIFSGMLEDFWEDLWN